MRRVFACSDFHGIFDAYVKIKNYLNPDDKVFFLGDASDRGDEGWKLIKTILNDKQFIYFRGNHEQMLLNAYYSRNFPDEEYHFYQLIMNGGGKTLEDMRLDPEHESILKCLNKTICAGSYNSPVSNNKIFLSHAGFNPEKKLPSSNDLIWDREHIASPWSGAADEYVVHGHTPVPYLTRYGASANSPFYCDGHKICLDNLTAKTGVAPLLNLDTFELIYP